MSTYVLTWNIEYIVPLFVSPLDISLLTNGSVVVLAEQGGSQSSPSAFLYICLISVLLPYRVVATFGTQETIYEDEFTSPYFILRSVAHLSHNSLYS